ncbi:hypothetical protein T265_02511 [Opisthorchis viverrini]|uniref:Mth938 domain-containing protein n=2 Tax=Opisthorchis viverrini TaxID=6198 RepID=A0A074ZVR3_OPIVI|nr:hypothetical protein T265_02511 [Opisthorchis viverrini]KER31186.1 hypothetical protein T265_02511 [Opisthorchis viverrini]
MDTSMKGAKARWKVLASAVLGYRSLEAISEEHHISGKMSLKLFKTSPLLVCPDTDSTKTNLSSSDWIELTPYDPQQSRIQCTSRTLRLNIGRSLYWADESARHLKERLRILSGFDNTGNVRLWLSELLLAHVFLVPHFYPVLWSRLNVSVGRVCELGAGMSGAVGLSVSLSPSSLKPHYILLSDGNDRCVKNLMRVVRYHLGRLDRLDTSTEFEVAKLVWPNQMTQVSPRIINMSWGSITVESTENGKINSNETVTYRDAKLWPGGSRAWDWAETGTGHMGGIQPTDVDELIAYNPDTVVLTRGVLYVLQVPESTQAYVREKLPGVELIVENSRSALTTYNAKVEQGKRVAALIHTTC